MLDWYRALLDLRRRYILPSERTCHAEWRDRCLTLTVPAHDPRLLVVADFQSGSLHSAPPGWTTLLRADGDGYSVLVCRRN
jgi:hypothetical protein